MICRHWHAQAVKMHLTIYSEKSYGRLPKWSILNRPESPRKLKIPHRLGQIWDKLRVPICNSSSMPGQRCPPPYGRRCLLSCAPSLPDNVTLRERPSGRKEGKRRGVGMRGPQTGLCVERRHWRRRGGEKLLGPDVVLPAPSPPPDVTRARARVAGVENCHRSGAFLGRLGMDRSNLARCRALMSMYANSHPSQIGHRTTGKRTGTHGNTVRLGHSMRATLWNSRNRKVPPVKRWRCGNREASNGRANTLGRLPVRLKGRKG